MTEQTERRTQEERRKREVIGCMCFRGTSEHLAIGCEVSERILADRRSTPKVAQLSQSQTVTGHDKFVVTDTQKLQSNGDLQPDPSCTPLPMGVPKMEQEIVQKIASNCGSSSTPSTTELPVSVQPAQVEYMVNRFLAWRLPENFNPDGGISFKPIRNEHTPYPAKNEPVGTNLLDFTQAEAMVRYLVDGMPSAEPAPPETPAAAQQELAEKELLDELGFAWKRQNSAVTVTIFREPFAVESLEPVRREYRAHFLLDEGWKALVTKHAQITALRSQLAAAESRLVEATRKLDEGWKLVARAHRRQDCYCDLCTWSGRAEDFCKASEVGAAPSQTQNAENTEVSNGGTPSAPSSAELPRDVRPAQRGAPFEHINTCPNCLSYCTVGPASGHCYKCEHQVVLDRTPSAPDTTQLPTQEKK